MIRRETSTPGRVPKSRCWPNKVVGLGGWTTETIPRVRGIIQSRSLSRHPGNATDIFPLLHRLVDHSRLGSPIRDCRPWSSRCIRLSLVFRNPPILLRLVATGQVIGTQAPLSSPACMDIKSSLHSNVILNPPPVVFMEPSPHYRKFDMDPCLDLPELVPGMSSRLRPYIANHVWSSRRPLISRVLAICRWSSSKTLKSFRHDAVEPAGALKG